MPETHKNLNVFAAYRYAEYREFAALTESMINVTALGNDW